MMTPLPDIFSNVHKGIRKALFEGCTALGRAGQDAKRDAAARALLRDALRFVKHHGENEDLLLLPLLEARLPWVFRRIEAAHGEIDAMLDALAAQVDHASSHELYQQTCEFTSRYLAHLHEEEQKLEPAMRAALSSQEIAEFGRRSVERTPPADQRMMLGWMVPAMTHEDVEALLARVPSTLADQLRSLALSP